MSADNYLYVRRWHGDYYIEHRFASVDYDDKAKPSDKSARFISADLAIHEAHRREREDYYEYGVRLSEDVFLDSLAP